MAKTFITQKEFIYWVNDMLKSYENRSAEFRNVRKLTLEESRANKRTIIMNVKTGKTAVAKCHKDDHFSPSVGLAVAWAKYLNKSIPVIADYVDYKDLKFLDKFYVSRSDNAILYQFVGIRKTENALAQVNRVIFRNPKVIFRNPKTGELFEDTEEYFTHNTTYDGKVWRVEA